MEGKEKKFFVEEGTVEFSNNTLIILSSINYFFGFTKKSKVSKMIEESKAQLNKEDLR